MCVVEIIFYTIFPYKWIGRPINVGIIIIIIINMMFENKRPTSLDAQLKLMLFYMLNTYLLYFTIR